MPRSCCGMSWTGSADSDSRFETIAQNDWRHASTDPAQTVGAASSAAVPDAAFGQGWSVSQGRGERPLGLPPPSLESWPRRREPRPCLAATELAHRARVLAADVSGRRPIAAWTPLPRPGWASRLITSANGRCTSAILDLELGIAVGEYYCCAWRPLCATIGDLLEAVIERPRWNVKSSTWTY